MKSKPTILAIDPGTTESAYVVYQDGRIVCGNKTDNESLLHVIVQKNHYDTELMLIEMIASYGMPVGAAVFETCLWIGRFIQAYDQPYRKIYRKDVKMHLCGNTKAKDSNIRQAIMDRYGSEKSIAIGTKNSPGKLYGISGDVWAALAVAITGTET